MMSVRAWLAPPRYSMAQRVMVLWGYLWGGRAFRTGVSGSMAQRMMVLWGYLWGGRAFRAEVSHCHCVGVLFSNKTNTSTKICEQYVYKQELILLLIKRQR